ncbi:MAG: crossover junction endodeoxyribonuclease RuvC, partial [bacterium]
MRILGVDPGTVVLGFGVLEKNSNGFEALDYGCLKLSSKEKFPRRLKKIYDKITGVIIEYQPQE